MRLRAVQKLININLLYTAKPEQLSKWRKQQLKNPQKKLNIGRKVMSMYIWVTLLYIGIFGLMGSTLPYDKSPGLFSNAILMFSLMVLSQGFLSFYNVFYESKDLESYMPLSFSEGEVLLGKSISVLLTVTIGIFPLLIYLILLQVKLGNFFLWAILEFLISCLILFTVLFGGVVVGVHYLTKTPVFRKHKKLVTNLLLGISTVVMIGAVILVNAGQSAALHTDLSQLPVLFYPFRIFYDLAVRPLAVDSLLLLAAWLLLSGLILYLLKAKVAKEFYQTAAESASSMSVTKRVRQMNLSKDKETRKKHFASFVWRYHWGLLSQGTTLVQTIIMSTLFPYLFLTGFMVPAFQNREIIKETLLAHPTMVLPFLVVGLAFGLINTGTISLISMGISLERENFDYLKVLPFDMRRYLVYKFWLIFAFQSILPLASLVVFMLLFGTPWYLMLSGLVAWLLTSYISSVHLYKRDYRLFISNWTNITELVNRESSLVRNLLILVVVFFGGGLVAGSALLALLVPSAVSYALAILLCLALLLGAGASYLFSFRPFIQNIQE